MKINEICALIKFKSLPQLVKFLNIFPPKNICMISTLYDGLYFSDNNKYYQYKIHQISLHYLCCFKNLVYINQFSLFLWIYNFPFSVQFHCNSSPTNYRLFVSVSIALIGSFAFYTEKIICLIWFYSPNGTFEYRQRNINLFQSNNLLDPLYWDSIIIYFCSVTTNILIWDLSELVVSTNTNSFGKFVSYYCKQHL